MHRLCPLLEFVGHLLEARNEFVSLVEVGLGHLVLAVILRILISYKVIKLVLLFILEHFG